MSPLQLRHQLVHQKHPTSLTYTRRPPLPLNPTPLLPFLSPGPCRSCCSMVQTRASQRPHSADELLEALLAGNSGVAKRLLGLQLAAAPHRASTDDGASDDAHATPQLPTGPSGFSVLHAAALTECHRMVPVLVEAGVPVDGAIEALDGGAAFALRKWLQEHSRLPSSKLCAVFRGVTPLHVAAWLGHTAMVQALLAAGADCELPCLEVGGREGRRAAPSHCCKMLLP